MKLCIFCKNFIMEEEGLEAFSKELRDFRMACKNKIFLDLFCEDLSKVIFLKTIYKAKKCKDYKKDKTKPKEQICIF